MAEINWTEEAISNIDSIAAFIGLSSMKAATGFVASAFQRVHQLQRFPRSGRMVPEVAADSLRELILDRRYRIVYRIDAEDRVTIIAVHDGKIPLNPAILDT